MPSVFLHVEVTLHAYLEGCLRLVVSISVFTSSSTCKINGGSRREDFNYVRVSYVPMLAYLVDSESCDEL